MHEKCVQVYPALKIYHFLSRSTTRSCYGASNPELCTSLHVPNVLKVSFEFASSKTRKHHRHLHNNSCVRRRMLGNVPLKHLIRGSVQSPTSQPCKYPVRYTNSNRNMELRVQLTLMYLLATFCGNISEVSYSGITRKVFRVHD